MSLEDGDIVRVVINATVGANNAPCINAYWFEVTEVTGVISTSAELNQTAQDVFSTLTTPIKVIQSSDLTYNSAVLDNMTNLIDIGVYVPATAVTGDIAAASNPTQTACSFKLIRTNRLTRNGSKRIGGIATSIDNDTTGEGFSTQPQCLAIENVLATPIVVVASGTGSCVLVPVIVRRPVVGSPVTVYQPVLQAVFRGFGSQNTRKRLLGTS